MTKTHRDYAVGVICATPIESVAARVMLDEEHESLPHDVRDINTYTLGRIGSHNVVVASLRMGFIGSTSAAVVARDMLWSFPALRICLLVGVGGGVSTSTHDIRLGDVVVGMPSETSGGVVQYDFGKRTSQGIYPSRGTLCLPPPSLLNAVHHLQAKLTYGEPEFPRYISRAYEKMPLLQRRFRFPGRDQDLLFQATYPHVMHEDCSLCERTNLITRTERNEQIPEVHYGKIASGNMVIKDAIIRDRISREQDVLCFEMEAAGIINSLPCLVIRGITDYADSHKNREWEGYAALTAAAYAKELLSVISPDVDQDITVAATLDLDLDLSGDPRIDLDVESLDTTSEGSTLIGALEPGTVDAAVKKVAEVLATDERLRSLCTAAALRINPHMLQWSLVTALSELSKALKKVTQSPVERAIRWLFSRYKPMIALVIAEAIYKQEHISGSLGLSEDDTSLVSDERFMKLVSDRFSARQSPFAASGTTRVDSADDEANIDEIPTQDLEEEIDLEIQEPPETADFTDLKHLELILCSGPVFESMFEKLKMLLFPPPPELIEKVLTKHIKHTTETFTVNCIVEWEVLEFVKHENLNVLDIDFICTLNGGFNHASASPLSSYMEAVWQTGKELLGAVKAAVAGAFINVFHAVQTQPEAGVGFSNQTQIQLIPASISDEKSHAVAQISGSRDYIRQTVEQLAWLTATLRLHHEGQLTVSYVDFQIQRNPPGETKNATFRLSLCSQDKLPHSTDSGAGQCWTSLFTESVLAYGFPLPGVERPHGMMGLELPFEVMAAFAGVKFPILLGKRLAFASDTNILIPEMASEDAIQWHFDRIDNIFQQAKTTTKVSDPRLENLDMCKLRGSRAFLGYNKISDVVFGTAEFDDVNIAACKVDRTGPAITLELGGPLGIGLGFRGYATASCGTTWKYSQGESAQIEGSKLSSDELFRRAAESSTLLYDDQKCIAFLIPELSVVLQMAASYLQKSSLLATSRIPRAKRSSNGGAAAYEAVQAAKDLIVPLRTGSPRKYEDVLRDFLLLLEQRKMQKVARRKFGTVSLKNSFKGWDFTDVQGKKFDFWERELKTTHLKPRPVWWKLFKESNAVILFLRAATYPLRGRIDKSTPTCISWATIPEEKHLLVANVRELRNLQTEVCQASAKYPTRFMLTNKLAWARPMHSRLFEADCTPGGTCNPVQTIRRLSAIRDTKTLWHREPEFRQHPGELELGGSVLFADDPSEFGRRQCHAAESNQTRGRILGWNLVFRLLCIPLLVILLWKALASEYNRSFIFRKGLIGIIDG